MLFKSIAAILLSFCAISSVFAQSNSINAEDKQRTVFDIRNEGGNKYLKVLNELKSFETKDRMQQAMKSAVITPIASFMAPNAEYDSLLSTIRHRFTADSLGNKIKDHGQFGLDAVNKTINNEISTARLVMFNEHHFYPNHRILVEQLLPLFAEAGFTYLGLEALNPGQDSLLNERQPPTIDSGFYIKDPHFANLVRAAQSLGFHFVAYENTDRDVDREVGQAANLYNATFAKNPDAKVLVLAGMDHILEKPTPRGKKWLGTILNESYNLNPVTINQHHLKWFQELTEDVALVPQSTFNHQLLNSVDFHLINNLPLNQFEPNFEYKNTYNQRVQLSIFLEKEKSDNTGFDKLIPIRSQIVEPSENISLFLPDSYLQLFIYDKNGKVIEEKSLR